MKRLCLIYSNCQGDGIAHFLKKVIAHDYDIVVWHNWQLMLGEQDTDDFRGALLGLARTGGVFIYQPTKAYPDKQSRLVPSTDEIIEDLNLSSRHGPEVKAISFPYNYNHGFFPFVKMGPGWDGWIGSEQVKEFAKHATSREARDNLIKAYFGVHLYYDCARRFIECLAEQSRREEETDIKMVPWILRYYRAHKLFLTYNHPTSVLFNEMAAQIAERLYPGKVWLYDCNRPENEAGMNGEQPVHPAVVRELGLQYPAMDHAIEYFHGILSCMINDLSA